MPTTVSFMLSLWILCSKNNWEKSSWFGKWSISNCDYIIFASNWYWIIYIFHRYPIYLYLYQTKKVSVCGFFSYMLFMLNSTSIKWMGSNTIRYVTGRKPQGSVKKTFCQSKIYNNCYWNDGITNLVLSLIRNDSPW